jgi:hypothetical protein
MSSIEIHTTLLQADWRACVTAWTERERAAARSWASRMFSGMRRAPKAPDEVGLVLGPATLRFDTAGVTVRQGLLHVVHAWQSVSEGTGTPEHLFLWLEGSAVIIVPVRSMPAGMPVAEFQSRVEALHDAGRRRPSAAVGSALQQSAPAGARMAAASLVDS